MLPLGALLSTALSFRRLNKRRPPKGRGSGMGNVGSCPPPSCCDCLTLQVVLLKVSPLVARLISVPDDLSLEELHDVLQLVLGWSGQAFYNFRIHGQEIGRRRHLRTHLLETAERIEADLGKEKPVFFDGSEQDWEAQPPPDGTMTVGIDGGFVRAAHKEGFFEVIAGKSVVDFRRSDEEATPSSKCFSFVQTFDQKPRRRLWELLKSQGMQENQQVVFVSDGGDSVRNLQAYLHPDSEHWLDWFHITMRITVLQQQVKTLKCEQPEVGEEVARELESTKHFLWHGNTFQALQRLEGLLIDLEFPEVPTPLTQKAAKGYRRIRDLHPQQ